jgi:hypothetical protein
MKKQIIILRLISAIFVVFAIMRLSTFFWAKLNLTQILHLLILSMFSITVAVGLLKRYQWARWFAMASMTIGLANSIVGAYNDIQLIAARSPGLITSVLWLAGVPLWAVIGSSIWWLAKSSTKSFFNDKLKTTTS